MAVAYKVLGQAALAATTLTDIYIVPALKYAIISTLVVCNRGAATTFRVSAAVAGLADTNKQYLYYDVSIPIGDTFVATIGITLAATDVVRAYAGHAQVSINIFGLEADV